MIERAGLTGGRCHNKLMPQFNKTLDCWDISEKSPLKHLFGMKLTFHPLTPDLACARRPVSQERPALAGGACIGGSAAPIS